MEHRTLEQLHAGLANIEASPKNHGLLEMIVRRPDVDEREVLESGELDTSTGLIGDTWKERGSSRTDDGSAHPDMQLNIINCRAIDLIAGDQERWALAGDQLYVDFDIGYDNLPPGTQLEIGDAVIEVTDQPHRGCDKFSARFGLDALRFVNSEAGRAVNARGINAKVVRGGTIATGDKVSKF